MRLSVVNIQSTSIEFSAIEIDENNFKTLLYDKEKLSIISYISNNRLLKKGYEKLKVALNYYKELSDNLLCDKHYYVATDSFRNFNCNSLLKKIKTDLNIDVYVVDQYTECFLVDYANKNKLDLNDSCLLDINGYCTQLIDLTRNKENFTLFDFGSLKVKYLYEEEDFNDYYDKLKKYFKRTFKQKIVKREYKKMYISGFFAKSMKKMYGDYYDIINPTLLEYKKCKKLFKYLLESPTKTDSLLNSIPKKLDFFMNGYIIFIRLAKYLHIDTIEISDFGFNEGFLLAVYNNIEELEGVFSE